MTDAAKDHLLAVRYLDDWAYQANIRRKVVGKYMNETGLPDISELMKPYEIKLTNVP